MDDVEHPDRLVFDLDPGADVTWTQVTDAAISVRKVLEAVDLESFAKTTGGRGVHVVVPLRPHATWPECLEFARALSERLVAADPGRYTTEYSKAGRSRKILIDYLRNNRTNTSIAAYSTRARAGATVSVPLRWEEVARTTDPSIFTAITVPQRLARLRADPWKGYWTSRQRLTRERLRAAAQQ
jgi:bifunctional non-homologous end joining protein LigD